MIATTRTFERTATTPTLFVAFELGESTWKLPSEHGYSERFRDFLAEAKAGRGFRAFASRSEAEEWLAAE